VTGRVDVTAALHTVIAQLAAGEPDAVYIAEALRLWLSSTDGVNLEAALGVSPTWRSGRLRARRDALICEVATYFPHLSGRPLAYAMAKRIASYETRAWQRDRRSGNRRSGLPGLLFDLLALGAPLLSEGSIRALMAKTRSRELPPREPHSSPTARRGNAARAEDQRG
jgi:hypothetical protein